MRCAMRGHLPGEVMAGSGRQALLLTLAALTVPAAFLINRSVPGAYMDEEFHVRQVQHYCRGHFEYWDPKITTFPGLYILSLAYIRSLLPLGQILGFRPSVNDICQPVVLRSVNVIFSFTCALLFREIILHFDPEKNMVGASVKALVLSLYPLHWFFNFLYYTELGSATAVMAMYLASLKHAYWCSAMFGAIGVMLRQTNAVWVIFVLCVGILDFIQHDVDSKANPQLEDDPLLAGEDQNHAHKFKTGKKSIEDGNALKSYVDKQLRKDGVRKRQSVRGGAVSSEDAQHSEPIIPSMVVQSIVNQGDKSAHQVSLHFSQLLYCGMVCTGFQAALYFNPQNLSYLVWVLKTSSKHCLVWCIIAAATAFIAVHYFSSAHPYLVADNRHYVFYVWKDVLQRSWSIKYILIPLYLFSWWSILAILGQREKVLWVVAFCLATAGVLVPAPLLDFRYYNVPFYFIFLHSCQRIPHEKYTLALMAIQFMAVNTISVYIFLLWPFEWPSEPGKLQRFMW